MDQTEELLQEKAEIINGIYKEGTALQRKVADVMLEIISVHSGFFCTLQLFRATNKLP